MPLLPWPRRRRRAIRAEIDRGLAELGELYENIPTEHYQANYRLLGDCMAMALERVKYPLDIVIDLGYSENEAGLIVLTDHRGMRFVPTYQLGERGHIARQHNLMLLDADVPPCQVVNWWYEHHPRLNRQPVELLGKGDPQLLTVAVAFTLQNR